MIGGSQIARRRLVALGLLCIALIAGYFFWLNFPTGVETAAVRPAALAAGVGFQPGTVFSTRGVAANCLRLSFSYYDEADIPDPRTEPPSTGGWHTVRTPHGDSVWRDGASGATPHQEARG